MILVELLENDGVTNVWPIQFYGLAVVLPDGNVRGSVDEAPGHSHGDLPISAAQRQAIRTDLAMGWVNGRVGRYTWMVREYRA